MALYNSASELIGNTPLLKLNNYASKFSADIYAKLMCRAIDKDEPTGLHKGFVTPPKEMKRKCNHTQSTTPCGDKDKS